MERKLRRLGRPLFESALIVFSVLFALYVNRWAENQRIERQKDIALNRIVQELEGNQEIIGAALQVHRSAMTNLQKASADENDSLRLYLADLRAFDEKAISFITSGASFYPQFPSSTSWNAAKSTTIIAEFDYEIVEALTDVYDTQEFFVNETLSYVMQTFYEPLSNDKRDTIGSLLLQIEELSNQEDLTLSNISTALGVIGGEKPSTGL